MQELSNSIYTYYVDHFTDLPFDKQFHFASRLYLWTNDPWAKQALGNLKPQFSANGKPEEALANVIYDARENPMGKITNAVEHRTTLFARYPLLQPCNAALFRLLFLRAIYDIDIRGQLFVHFSQQELDHQVKSLIEDDEALAILSTYAINFLYLYERFVRAQEDSLPLERFLTVGQTYYNRSDNEHLQLLIYLYTHCIIGESLFYQRVVPAEKRAVYTKMLQELEDILSQRFQDIHLDNKLEFLVTCQLTGYTSQHQQKIFSEAATSKSDEGDFLIDRHNNFPQSHKTEFDTSEHRNVLFIMASRQFKPRV